MKDVLMMMTETCPHCRRAREMMETLCARHPEFQKVNVKMVDERVDPEFADKLDYYYIPTFFVDGKKLHEGVPTEAAIEAVYRAACECEERSDPPAVKK